MEDYLREFHNLWMIYMMCRLHKFWLYFTFEKSVNWIWWWWWYCVDNLLHMCAWWTWCWRISSLIMKNWKWEVMWLCVSTLMKILDFRKVPKYVKYFGKIFLNKFWLKFDNYYIFSPAFFFSLILTTIYKRRKPGQSKVLSRGKYNLVKNCST
jgi:hypothetical protein